MVFQEVDTFVYAHADHCSGCSRVLDPTQARAVPGTSPSAFDIALTLDGAVIASDGFVAVAKEVPAGRLEPLDGMPGWWTFTVDRIVRIDPFDSHYRTGPSCDICGEPRYITRSGPIRLEEDEVLDAGFSRTASGFGDTADFGDHPVLLRPHILLDRVTGRTLKGSGLLGIHLITHD